MPRYKRTADEAGLDVPSDPPVASEHVELLHKLRNMWEFASFMQYLYLFGKAVKIDDDFDMEDLEAESLKPQPSERLAQIGLQLLKYVSSHRGLNFEIWDEYVRRQYLAKAPLRNPYGEEEEPAKFQEFDIFTRIRVLHQLSTWTLHNYDRLRSMMPEDEDQTTWRMEPLGWDKDDRSYFVLDDNRLYRRTDAPLPKSAPPKAKPKPKQPKAKSVKKQKSAPLPRPRGTRTSKRLKVEEDEEEQEEAEQEEEDPEEMDVDHEPTDDEPKANGKAEDDSDEPAYGFTSKTWELVAITLEEYQEFLSTIFRAKDPNERILRKRLEEEVMPIIEKRADQLRQKELKKLRELENLQKMALAKRSSRLAGKAEKEKEEREKREAEEKRQAELRMAREEEEKQKRIEEGHESRRQTREQRLKDREVKRILHEEELKKLKELEERAESQGLIDDDAENKRISARNARLQKEQHQRELERLAEEEEGGWYFDCSKCGMHGENLDDGSHSVACDKCGVWQHSKCLGITPKQAEDEDFVFVCGTCKRKEEDAKRPKIPPIKLGKKASPDSAKVFHQENGHAQVRTLDGVYVPQPSSQRPLPQPVSANGPGSSPYQGANNHRFPPVSNFAPPTRPQQSSPVQGAAQTPNGHVYAAPPYQQHHRDTHAYAVASSGAHPGYHAPNYYANGHSPQISHGHYADVQTPQQHHHQQAPAYPSQYGHATHNVPNRQWNGAPSPIKSGASPMQPAQQHLQLSTATTPRADSQGESAQIHQSPKTWLPPPVTQNHSAAPSPQKSPAAPHAHQTHPNWQTSRTNLSTPGARMGPADHPPASTGPSNIVVDGMSGPWPAGSEAIPKKHDHSPVPPASSQTIGEKLVMPPVATLAPSPQQHNADVSARIPVKKLQDAPSPGLPTSSPLPAPAVSPLAPRSLGDQSLTQPPQDNPGL